jgi:hypothetical protein
MHIPDIHIQQHTHPWIRRLISSIHQVNLASGSLEHNSKCDIGCGYKVIGRFYLRFHCFVRWRQRIIIKFLLPFPRPVFSYFVQWYVRNNKDSLSAPRPLRPVHSRRLSTSSQTVTTVNGMHSTYPNLEWYNTACRFRILVPIYERQWTDIAFTGNSNHWFPVQSLGQPAQHPSPCHSVPVNQPINSDLSCT